MNSRSLLLILALGGGAGALQAQGSPIRKGSIQVAGTASFTHSRNLDFDAASTTLQVSPRIAYFVVRGLAVNGTLEFDRRTGGGSTTTAWGVGPGLTYYFDLHSRYLYPFLSGRTLLLWSRVNTAGLLGPTTTKGTNRSWLVSGGALFMVGTHVGISGELYYQKVRFGSGPAGEEEGVSRSESYGLAWGIAAFVF